MGIHGNATCQMILDGAVGTLVGQPHKGLAAMFVMMNAARLGVGNQSLGLTEVAYQNALAYAKDRIQMRSLSGAKAKDKAADPIIVHPDVRKMLLTAKAYAEGGRAMAIYCALLLDKELHHPDEKVRQECGEMVALNRAYFSGLIDPESGLTELVARFNMQKGERGSGVSIYRLQ